MRTRVLNVAEKPSVARAIATHLSSEAPRRRVKSDSKFNPVEEFEFSNQTLGDVTMQVTSVTGHLMELEFEATHRNWGIDPATLFDAPVQKHVPPEKAPLKQNLQRLSASSDFLILWLDCDREGENIASEVRQLCVEANPGLKVLRAVFSALTPADVHRACETLGFLNENMCIAVDARQEFDLRVGAAFTRHLTTKLLRKFHIESKVLSYGPCQFPTLGLIARRHMQRAAFTSEDFWSLELTVACPTPCTLKWHRGKFFRRLPVLSVLDAIQQESRAYIVTVHGRHTFRRRPLPLTTVDLTKLAARRLRMASDACMRLAEGLYNRGIISYPRTETDSYPETIDLTPLVEAHVHHGSFGSFVQRMLRPDGPFCGPRKGGKSDGAHPPIHPVKSLEQTAFENTDEWRLYELVTRHFLASCSDDAKGAQVSVALNVAGEQFDTSGLTVTERNYLDVYIFDQWTDKSIPTFQEGATVPITGIEVTNGQTQPPLLLAEDELIGLMDRYGIGTDATMHEHIKTVQERHYANKKVADSENCRRLEPTDLGLALVEGHMEVARQSDALDLAKPFLRSEMEADLTQIASGAKSKEEVLSFHLGRMRRVFDL
ncbi:MAG: hypothetical protein KVP17_004015 [Porospora cf. gigantea B]|uniref:uncharacterized protein n=2 Tax=Porospora cf. gigantea B TaxID=2853592 RepID=UPI003571A230|nr:MAG: hypothetical protein KVP17_004015 [Porospora cf. gigantea B]